MDMKKLFINLIIVLFIGVSILSAVTVVKRSNEPKEEYVVPNNMQSVVVEDDLPDVESTEAVIGTETTEIPDATETSESEAEPEVVGNRSMYVIGSVNMRSGPGITYTRIGSLSLNMEVTAIGPAENGWQKIQYRDKEGYVSMELLSETPIETTPAQPQQPVTQPTEPEVAPEQEVMPEQEPVQQPETTPESSDTPTDIGVQPVT